MNHSYLGLDYESVTERRTNFCILHFRNIFTQLPIVWASRECLLQYESRSLVFSELVTRARARENLFSIAGLIGGLVAHLLLRRSHNISSAHSV